MELLIMWKTLRVLAVVASTFFVPSTGTPNCETPTPLCPNANEIYDTCLSPCPPRYCGVNIAVILCAKPTNCTAGCRCRDGTLRDGNGVCIPEEKCPTCGLNEIYDVCPVKCPPQRCGVDPAVIRCRAPPQPGSPDCEPGCRCVDGFLRNDAGVCVPPEKCSTSTCKENEEWTDCIATCNLQNCSQLGFPIPCESSTDIIVNCVKGCTCKQGYLRADDGNCIPIESCPSCSGDPNAESGCGNCGRHCSDIGKPPGGCAADCKYNDCKCREGFVFDDNLKKCVTPKECSTSTCKENEEWTDCIATCNLQNCSQLGFPIPCESSTNITVNCVKGCTCKQGYLRADDGNCIPIESCPSCRGDPNAESGCGNCGRHCSDIGKPQGGCAAVCKYNDCKCRQGFVFDDNLKKCVTPKECTPDCGKNEYFSSCPIGECRAVECNQVGFPVACPSFGEGGCTDKPRCICREGYARNEKGVCVLWEECPTCGGDPNARPGCGVNCNKHCSDLGNSSKACIEICYYNACDCKDGFYYDENTEKCVKPKDCTPKCNSDEVWSNCINRCSPLNCSQLGFPIKCPKTKICTKGCICKDGMKRANNGSCVPVDTCPSCGGDPNAVSGCGGNCKRCSDVGKPPRACTAACTDNACQCRNGFVYDEKTKKCVKPEDCLKCTGPNEYFACKGACDNVCATLHKQNQTSCPIINKKCNPMCYCDEGYARDRNNICIPIKLCSQVCGVNERFVQCPAFLCEPQTCSELGFPMPCPLIPPDSKCPGNSSCLCIEGYLRNDKGVCVPKKSCPSCGGDPNAVSGCGINCGRLCSNYNKGPVPCPKICRYNACDCKPDFVFDENTKTCVRPKQCTQVCKENEVYSECINGGCSAKNCSQLGRPVPCVKLDPKYCIKGCLCKEGYLRDSNGICIPKDQCQPQVCKENEVYSKCINGGCSAKNCSQLGRPVPCIKLDPKYCIKGCLCKEGYLRDSNGICIPKDQCQQCGKNERYESCPDSLCSPQQCSQLGFPIPCPGVTADGQCPGSPGCVCDNGFVRNDEGTCIPTESCPSCGGDPNAVSGCGKNCGRLCSNYDKGPVDCTLECNLNACDCRKGFVFDENTGKCVRPEECSSQCSKNQIYDSCVNSGCRRRSCADPGILCIDPLKCEGGCRCRDGYLLDAIGNCIPADECPKCGINERYEKCPSSICSAQNCSQLGFPLACPATANDGNCTGPPGCVCEDGYLRNDKGVCVLINECPSCGGDPNAVSGCGIHCGNLCSNYNKGPVPCPLICKLNSCDCKKGFVFDQNIQQCVLPENCTPTCKANEVYDTCANGGCSRRNCSQLNEAIKCVRPKKCIGGCVCAEGFLRNKKGVCVPKNKCPRECNRPNEYYASCSHSCPPQTCESIGKRYNCPLIKSDDCEEECRCKPGFYRNKIGECISEEECLKCPGPNEYFSCGGACDNVCSNIHEQNQTHCKIINIKCNPMCYCLKDFARDKNGVCIPIKECPEPPCGRNEQYEECPSECEPRKCTDLGFPITCQSVPDGSCNTSPACICKDGYVRNEQGDCIPKTDCPSCGGDPNAVTGCSNYCGNRCSDYNKGPTACPLFCLVNGCGCREGYVYDNNIGKCVLPENCTEVCGVNQVYDSCANGGCRRRKCTDLGGAILCIDPIKCLGGCRCQDDYLLAEDGSCVPKEECPNKCKGPNEKYACQAPCDNECKTLDVQNQTSCRLDSIQCKCFCANGTARDEKGICIPIEDCPDRRCGANERYEENPATFCEPLDCTEVGFPIDCPIEDPECEVSPACVCNYGFVRNSLGDCIPKTECPSCGGDKNAVAGCGVKCGNTCSDYDKEVSCILICYRNGCDCRKGFVYDEESKKCVRPENCPVPSPTETKPSPTFNNTEIKERLNIGSIALTGEFVYQMLSGSTVTSFVASGTSLLTALAQITYFATGLVLDQLLKLLNLRSPAEIKSVYPDINANYENQKEVIFEVANKYYSNINYPLSKNFTDFSIEIFHASGENIEFAKNVEAARIINSWVENKTRDKIKDLVNADMFSSDTRLVCVNAIYFLGNWFYQFNPNDTETKDFYLDDTKTIQIPIMYQQNTFNYYEDDGLKIQALEMRYKGGNFSFFIILPREKGVEAVKNVASHLREPANFKKIVDNMSYEKVKVYIPRMLIETRLDMAEMLKKANVTEMFDSNSNGFHGILQKDEPISVSDIVQKAFIAVDETGTEAAAATAIIVGTTSAVFPTPKIYELDATHPYLYYIRLNDEILFCGTFLGV